MRRLFLLVAGVCLCSHTDLASQKPGGTWEGEISDPRRPLVITVDFDQSRASINGGAAVPVADRSGETTGSVAFDVLLNGATVRFEGRQSLSAIQGTAKAGSREFPFTLRSLPPTRPDVPRATAWAEDLEAVEHRFLLYERSFAPAARREAIRRLGVLRQAAARRTDQQILVELARIVALSDNAHSRLYFVRNRTEVRRLPIRGWWFRREFRIVRATSVHRDLLGCRLIRIGGTSVDEAYRKLNDLKAGNESWRRYMSAYFLTSPDVLAGAGITHDPETTDVELDCQTGRRQVALHPQPLKRSSNAVEAWWDLAPQHPAVDAVLAPALDAARAPAYLQRTSENYWFDYRADLGALYLQYNRAEAIPDLSIATFAERVAEAIAVRSPRACIIDVRFNTGGNLDVGTSLVDRLAPLCRPLRVFIVTGRATFSAGITHAAQWKQVTGGTVVGEPVGDRLDFWSEGGNLTLPHSGLTVHYANAFHRYSMIDYPDRKPYFFELHVESLEPAIPVEPDWQDYITGRDPVIEAIAAVLKPTRP